MAVLVIGSFKSAHTDYRIGVEATETAIMETGIARVAEVGGEGADLCWVRGVADIQVGQGAAAAEFLQHTIFTIPFCTLHP